MKLFTFFSSDFFWLQNYNSIFQFSKGITNCILIAFSIFGHLHFLYNSNENANHILPHIYLKRIKNSLEIYIYLNFFQSRGFLQSVQPYIDGAVHSEIKQRSSRTLDLHKDIDIKKKKKEKKELGTEY